MILKAAFFAAFFVYLWDMALSFFQKISRAVIGKSRVDDDTLDAVEEALVESDMGVDTTLKVIDALEERVEKDKYMSQDELIALLRDEISKLIPDSMPEGCNGSDCRFVRANGSPDPLQSSGSQTEMANGRPYVILVVGVNGVGKTTTIGKLAHYYKSQGKKVVLGAADTFRAAAVDQIVIWAERAGVDIVRQEMGSDPAAVAYDTVKSAVAKGAEVVLIDTAGRLHNRIDLMNELTKIRNSVRKVVADAPDEVMLVLDGSTGQNAFAQAKEFSRATDITSLVVTKLDGTAKGGVIVGVSDQYHIPVRFIGTGEGIEDIKPFDKAEFVKSLFSPEDIK